MNKNKIRVMYIAYSLNIGGLERLILSLTQRLDKDRFSPSVCSLSDGLALEREFSNCDIPVYLEKKKRGIDFTLVFRLAKLFKDKNIDLVHTHNPCAWLYGGIAAKLAGKKLVHTEHSNLFNYQKRLMLAEKILAKFTDRIICDSDKVEEYLKNKEGIRNLRIQTIFNGVDVREFERETDKKYLKEQLSIDNESLVIGSVARLVPIKDQITLIEAFKIVTNNFDNLRLVIVGDGPLRESLVSKVKSLKLEDEVKFLGERNDISKIMKIFNIFVLTSIDEGLPIALLEAMATGLPVITTSVGAIPEVVIDGKTGILVPIKDKNALANSIISLLNDEEKRRTMGSLGRKRIEEEYSLEKMVASYQDAYFSVLNGKSRADITKPGILVFTNVYPRDFQPNKGLDIKEQIQGLKRYFDIKVIAPVPKNLLMRDKKQLPKKIWIDGIEVYQPRYLTLPKIGVLFSRYTYFASIYKFLKSIRKDFPFELIISYWVYPDGFAAAKYAEKFEVPLIIRPRGSDINVWMRNSTLRQLIKSTLSRADKVIPVCADLKEKIRQLGISEDRLSVVTLGVDSKQFLPLDKDECRRKLNLKTDKKIILFIGNLIEIKGIDYFLGALKILEEKGRKDIYVIIIGSGKLESRIREITQNFNNITVDIKGEVSNIELPLWMNASDLFCLPSLSEGFPNVIMEALSCGVPVVTTDVGGIPEIIQNDKLGILVPPKDSKALADGIEKALERKWDRELLVERVKSETWDKIAQRLKDECFAVINGEDK